MSDQPLAQRANIEMVDLLRPWFVDRNEPNYAWKSACSAVLALPGLRAFWPMSSVDYTTASRARDVAGGGYHLSDNNTVTFGYDQLAPYAEFDGTNQHLSRADGGAANWADIRGTEAYVTSTQRGLSLGGWFYFDNAAGANSEYCIAKATGATVGTLAYGMARVSAGLGGTGRFLICDGASIPFVNTGAALGTTQWYFLVGRFVPSTSVDIYWNNPANNNVLVKNSTVAGVIASIQDLGAQFTVGARGDPALYIDGKGSLCFLCAAALSDSIITALYHNTRKVYGV